MDRDRYTVTVHYDKEDETEMVIRVLSFGPMLRVTGPQHFIDLIKQRLTDQKSCGQGLSKHCGRGHRMRNVYSKTFGYISEF